MSLAERHNAKITGAGRQTIVFAHGFGCDQNMWRFVAPAFEDRFRVVVFDYIGHGNSDRSTFDAKRYATLDGYAQDVVALCRELGVRDGVFVGHSVSAMIGMLAAQQAPELFAKLVLIGPSPRYVDDADYTGGFTEAQILEMLEFLDSNHMGWSTAMAPSIIGNADRPELGQELTNSFCRTDPEIAKRFARATFLSDNRADLAKVKVPTLILQCSNDIIAPNAVGEYVHRNIAGSRLVVMEATGHCPNLSAPQETIAAIDTFV